MSDRTDQPIAIPASWDRRPGARELNISRIAVGPEMVKAGLEALRSTNDPAILFQRFGRLVAVVHDESGLPVITDVSHAGLRGFLMRAAEWEADVRLPNGQVATQAVQPPGYVVADIHAHGDWPLPALRGISPIPVLRADGSLHTAPGYDSLSGWWYEPGKDLGEQFSLSEPITTEHVRNAVVLLTDWLADFCFIGEAERANAIALFLTVLARPAIVARGDNIPLALVEATKPRTGKTLLVESILLAAYGDPPALTSVPTDEAEMRKLLASYALHGKPYVCFDNVAGKLDSPALASVLTTGLISDRLLRTNDTLDMRADFTLVVTGNQLEATGELLARAYRVKLDAQMSRPRIARASCSWRTPPATTNTPRTRPSGRSSRSSCARRATGATTSARRSTGRCARSASATTP
jgi:hypothetical protein